MAIIYAVVSRGSVILAEYANAKGTFDQVVRKILEKVPMEGNTKLFYDFEK